jgi:light-harvesting complex 1 beta chain
MAHNLVNTNTSVKLDELLKYDSTVFALIFVASFALLFIVAVTATLLTWPWRSWLPGAEGATSIIGGVKSAVYTFMSHLT